LRLKGELSEYMGWYSMTRDDSFADDPLQLNEKRKGFLGGAFDFVRA